ncbi:MAG: xanthine dehydrogenase family protein molybdopterin-binding subunit [Thaumarchaeota archaeon]|nr:xanthine dehydrogenase family protein molybdopterin-binding subunit [Candidatus Calditenuaceae archaeon]MDW8186686.1 xanthine dehydrogenase family protein molybdopterin-binding subunit [Nitrososphaerota archaeon]
MKRKEDLRFLTGKGLFTDDLKIHNALHAVILRSPYPHARIKSIDTLRAEKLPGVRAVLIGAHLKDLISPFRHLIDVPPYYPMAVDKVRYVGEPVVALAAEDKYTARDATELIDIDYEPLDAVVDVKDALREGAPLVHEGYERNVAWHREFSYGDPEEAFSRAEWVVRGTYRFHRYSSTPLEPYACAVHFDRGTGVLTVWDQNQQVGLYRARFPAAMRMPEHLVRHITLDIGGGFGNKVMCYSTSAIVAALGILTERPVKWMAARSEDMSQVQSADRLAEVEMALRKNGEIIGMKVKIFENIGAWLRHPEPQTITRGFFTFTGAYRIRDLYIDATAVFTNKAPTVPNRGYGCHPAYFHLERMVDKAATELGIDGAELRLRNFVRPEEMPYTTPLGCVYDGGDYPEALKLVMEKIGYWEFRRKQPDYWAKGVYKGIGAILIVEPASTHASVTALWGSPIHQRYASTSEAAMVRVHPTGKVVAALGTVPQGQGHETVVAQIVADVLSIDPDDVEVLPGFDSHTHPFGGESGTYASRFAVVGAGAVYGAAVAVREKALRIAANLLEVRAEDLEMQDGRIYVKEDPSRYVTLREVARAAYHQLAMLPKGEDPGLEETYTYRFPVGEPADEKLRSNYSSSYAYMAGGCIVEVDPETGSVKVERLVIVHDAGTVLNPLIMDGQVHGATYHGIAGALLEEFAYSQDGYPLATNFVDYLAPTSADTPDMEVYHTEHPSPFSPLGSKGSGEGTTILMPPLLACAVEDALRPFAVEVNELPLSPQRLWSLIARRR